MKKKILYNVTVAVATALLFFAATMPFRSMFQFVKVTEVRPVSALPPALGLMFGPAAAVGCATGNLVADYLQGYTTLTCVAGFFAQLLYGFLPWLIWKHFKTEVRLNSLKMFVRYALTILFNSAFNAFVLGVLMQVQGLYPIFSTTTAMFLYNNLVFSMILGIPIVIAVEFFRLRKRGMRLSLNEKFVLIFIMLGVLTAVLTGTGVYSDLSPYIEDSFEMWDRIFFFVTVDLAVFYIITGLFLRYSEKHITVPVEKIADIAREYVDSDAANYSRLASKCSDVRQDGSEIHYLSKALSDMLNNIDNDIERISQLAAEKERVKAELDIASHIQQSLLPQKFPYDRRLDLYAEMKSAKEVGGDFYDFFMLDNRHMAVVIADVSDKGVPAALFMVIGKTLIKEHTTSSSDLGRVFTEVNNLLCEANSEDMFITAFEGVLDIETGEFRYVNAGHEPPFVYYNGSSFEKADVKPDFVLAGMENVKYNSGVVNLNEGDKIFLYTDGVTEAANAQNELYGDVRLENILNKGCLLSPHMLVTYVKTDIFDFTNGFSQSDDITMLCLEYKGNTVIEEMTVAALVENIEVVTERVNSMLQNLNCSQNIMYQLDVVIDELFGNIVRYAYPENTGMVSIKIEVVGSFAEITFVDKGIKYNPLNAEKPDVTLSADERGEGGLGVFIAEKFSDSINYENKNGFNILKVKKKITE